MFIIVAENLGYINFSKVIIITSNFIINMGFLMAINIIAIIAITINIQMRDYITLKFNKTKINFTRTIIKLLRRILIILLLRTLKLLRICLFRIPFLLIFWSFTKYLSCNLNTIITFY